MLSYRTPGGRDITYSPFLTEDAREGGGFLEVCSIVPGRGEDGGNEDCDIRTGGESG